MAVSVIDFGADPTGIADSTDAFNSALGASEIHTGNNTSLKREVLVPAGKYKINGQIFPRKGQHLRGDGMGATYIDCTGASSLGGSVMMLGQSKAGAPDPGGLFCEVSDLLIEGGPLAHSLIDTTQCAGWKVENVDFLNCSTGILASGTEGIVDGCYFDINTGQTGISISGQNIIVSCCGFYIGNYHIIVLDGANNIVVSDCQFIYPKYAGVYLAPGATIARVALDGCTFDMNIQYSTHQGYVYFASSAADLTATGCVFSNGKAGAFQYSGSGIGGILVVSECVIDGAKSESGYAQSTTAAGIAVGNMNVTVTDTIFRRLPGQPISLGGGGVTSVMRISGCTLQNNTGGTADILITDTNSGSVLYLDNCRSTRRLLGAQNIVPVFAPRIAEGRATLSGGMVTVPEALVKNSSNLAVMRQIDGGTVGASYSISRNPGVSFTIRAMDGAGASQPADTSTIGWIVDLAG